MAFWLGEEDPYGDDIEDDQRDQRVREMSSESEMEQMKVGSIN